MWGNVDEGCTLNPETAACEEFDVNKSFRNKEPVMQPQKLPCIAYHQGKCNRGPSCRFSHGASNEDCANFLPVALPCARHQEGRCQKGSRCRYEHSEKEVLEPLAIRSRPCILYLRGICVLGSDCQFTHTRPSYFPSSSAKSKFPCLGYQKGFCPRGEGCKFSHSAITDDIVPLVSMADDNMFGQQESMFALKKLSVEQVSQLLLFSDMFHCVDLLAKRNIDGAILCECSLTSVKGFKLRLGLGDDMQADDCKRFMVSLQSWKARGVPLYVLNANLYVLNAKVQC
jgi:hypothetical protein